MLVSQFVSGTAAEFSLVRSGNQLTATFHYDLTGFEDEEGIFHWDGEIGASIGAYNDYFQQTSDRPMDLQFVATLVSGVHTAASYFVNDNIGGAAFDHEFNIVIFNAAANFVGTTKADLVFGSAAADTFRSVGAGDMFEGGAGNDIYAIYDSGTQVFEAAGGGASDRIGATVSYVLAADVEIELLTTTNSAGTAAIDFTGNKLHQEITGNAGNNVLRSGSGNVLGEGDVLRGLGGDDTYRVSNAADLVVEAVGAGNDRVMAAASFNLAQGAEVELLTTNGSTGTSDIWLGGNELSQTIIGNAGDNIIWDNIVIYSKPDLKSSADVLKGLAGDDLYVVTNAGTVIVEGTGGGNDVVGVQISNYVLDANAQVETLLSYGDLFDIAGDGVDITGNRYSTTIKGDSGENTLSAAAGVSGTTYTLSGGRGDDILIGGEGVDIFIGDGGEQDPYGFIADRVSYEGASAGVVANVADPSLNKGAAAGDTYSGIEGLTGTAFDDTLGARALFGSTRFTLSGGAGYDTLIGSAGNDLLDLGADGGIAKGGGGSDYYVLETATNYVLEDTSGIDAIGAYFTFTLPDTSASSFENLTLLGSKAINGTGNELDNSIAGNKAKNTLMGLEGNDKLSGGAGDTLDGGAGDDTYYPVSTTTIIEAAGNGFDTIIVSGTSNIVLSADAEIELLRTTGGVATINLTGNDFGQRLIGNAVANILDAGGGDDELLGLAGNDTLYGREGADTFVFMDSAGSEGIDTIADFSSSEGDMIAFRNAIFHLPFPGGVLDASVFRANTTGLAEDADDRLIYNTTNGELSYDSDGTGKFFTHKLAVLTGIPTLTAASFETF